MDSRETPVLEARRIRKSYGEKVVLEVDRFAVHRGETAVILGPSGAGKSVFLRILNLLESFDSGEVLLDGVQAQALRGAERQRASRRMAMIFQDPLLFVGSVQDNVAFGLKVRRVPQALRAARVERALEVVDLVGLASRDAGTLSGGEAQRVALARALAIEPDVLLLDEPFANLDAPTRRALQVEVKRILRSLRMTAVFVTHDQEEAARLAHRILVLENGRIAQEGGPREIFYEPRSEFVAGFVGFDNMYEGEVRRVEEGLAIVAIEGGEVQAVAGLPAGSRATVAIRPEDIALQEPGSRRPGTTVRNSFDGSVEAVELLGPVARVTVSCPFRLVAEVTRRSLEDMDIREGSRLRASFKAAAVVVVPGGAAAGARSQ